jgi:hypothetical protein
MTNQSGKPGQREILRLTCRAAGNLLQIVGVPLRRLGLLKAVPEKHVEQVCSDSRGAKVACNHKVA